MALTALALASTAVASAHHPTGEFALFTECPLSRLTLTNCVAAEIKGGAFTFGTKTVPLKSPVRLQGGFEGAGSRITFFGAQNGETLSKVPQPLPAGTLDIPPAGWPKSIQNWFNESIRKGPGITATVELAAPATAIKLNTGNLLFEAGVALQLPIKVKLDSPALGSSCYLGSNQSPIVLPLGTGASGKLKGAVGETFSNEDFTLITLGNAKLVSSTFALSAASGCGGTFSAFIDPFVSSIFGASTSGKNSAILEVTLSVASAEAVRESE